MKVIQISLDNDMKTGTRGNLEFGWYEAMILSLLPCGVPGSKECERGCQGVRWRLSVRSKSHILFKEALHDSELTGFPGPLPHFVHLRCKL